MYEELKPCPFCGAEVCVESDESQCNIHYIYCHNCHIKTKHFENIKYLVKMWNSRYSR